MSSGRAGIGEWPKLTDEDLDAHIHWRLARATTSFAASRPVTF